MKVTLLKLKNLCALSSPFCYVLSIYAVSIQIKCLNFLLQICNAELI